MPETKRISQLLCHALILISVSTVFIYVLGYKDPLKVVIYESEQTPQLSGSIPNKLIFRLLSVYDTQPEPKPA